MFGAHVVGDGDGDGEVLAPFPTELEDSSMVGEAELDQEQVPSESHFHLLHFHLLAFYPYFLLLLHPSNLIFQHWQDRSLLSPVFFHDIVRLPSALLLPSLLIPPTLIGRRARC